MELPGLGSAAVDLAVDPVLGAIERFGADLQYLEAHKTDLELKDQTLSADDQREYRVLELDVATAILEKAVRKYEKAPWLKEEKRWRQRLADAEAERDRLESELHAQRSASLGLAGRPRAAVRGRSLAARWPGSGLAHGAHGAVAFTLRPPGPGAGDRSVAPW